MWLKPEPVSSIFAISTSSQWICTACRTTSQHQLRKASTAAARTKASAAPSSPRKYQPKRPAPIQADPNDPNHFPASPTDLIPLPTLNFVIGSDVPPKPGQNPALDPRPYSKRWEHWWSKEGGEERAANIKYELSRGYYADWHRMRRRRGKTFMAPDQPFQASMAKYFPNFQGYSLANSWQYVDTSKMLMGKLSVVSYTREHWSKNQAETFVGEKQNPALAKLFAEAKEEVGLQRFFIRYESEWLKRVIMYMCLPYARRKARGHTARTLVVTKGVGRLFLKDNLGVTNTRVGYVYLVDASCKIRWMGNGDATEEERADLVRVLKRLIQERRSALEQRNAPLVKKPVKRKDDGPKPLSAMMI